jgi:hypothetical protein
MEKSRYNTYPADMPELIEAMQAGMYNHLQIFLSRNKSTLDLGFGQKYLVLSRNGFGLYELKSVDYIDGILQLLFTDPATGNDTELNLDVTNEHPEHYAIRLHDLKDILYAEITSDSVDDELWELEDE